MNSFRLQKIAKEINSFPPFLHALDRHSETTVNFFRLKKIANEINSFPPFLDALDRLVVAVLPFVAIKSFFFLRFVSKFVSRSPLALV